MLNIFISRPFLKPFIIWRNPNASALAGRDSLWTAKQLYLEAKGDRAEHKVLEMAVRKLQ
jgi:hypothetical protein